MNFQKITEEYYSHWLDKEMILKDQRPMIHVIPSKERDCCQYGYSKPFDLWALRIGKRIYISYGTRIADKILLLKEKIQLDMTSEEIKRSMEDVLQNRVTQGIKYVFREERKNRKDAVVLGEEQYKDFRKFFAADDPDADYWLKEYYEEMVQVHACCGVYDDGRLASCTDAPGMPYMIGLVHEIGINTLPGYRKKGYAADACAACVHEIILNGKCPMWSTGIENIASQKLAEAVGFDYYGDYFALSL